MAQPPAFTHSLPPQVEATNGDIVTFQVRVTGDPKPVVTWLRCGEVVYHLSGRRDIVQHNDGWYELVVTNLSEDDEGEYECRAENAFGQASCFGDLYYYLPDCSESIKGGDNENMDGDGRQSGLLIVIDDGSQTDDDSIDDPTYRRSMTASEQMQGIIEDLTQAESLTIEKDIIFPSDQETEEDYHSNIFEDWQYSSDNAQHVVPLHHHFSAMSEDWDRRVPSSTETCLSCPVSTLHWNQGLTHPAEQFADISSETISSLSTFDPESSTYGRPYDLSPELSREGSLKSSRGSVERSSKTEPVVRNRKVLKFTEIAEEVEIPKIPNCEARADRSVAATDMSYSRSTFRSTSSKYSEGISDDSISRSSIASTGLRSTSRFDTGDALSSIRRTSRPTFDDDDDTFSRRSRAVDDFGSTRRSLRLRLEDDIDSGIDSVRRTSRLSSRDDDDMPSVRRTSRLSSRDEDDTSAVRRSYLTSRFSKDEDDTSSARRSYLSNRSSIKDEDDVSSVRRSYLSKRSSKDEEDNVSIRSTKTTTSSFDDDDSRSFRKTTHSSALTEDDNSFNYRKSKITSGYDVDDTSSVMSVKSSHSSVSYEQDAGIPRDSITKRIMSKSESISSETESKVSSFSNVRDAIGKL